MKIQTLISTMHLKNAKKLVSEMNVAGDYVIVNQCDVKDERKNEDKKHLVVDTNERGLSKSRNMALKNCSADVALIADDDIEYVDRYEEIIEEGFKKYPKADAIAFYLDSDDKKNKKKKLKPGRIRGIKIFKIASWQLAIRKEPLNKKGISFDEDFGSGSRYIMGEENILLSDIKRKGLKIYSHPIKIGTVREKRESTWFKKFDKEYFVSRGAGYYRISKLLYPFYIAQFAIRKKSLYSKDMSFSKALKTMFKGASEYKAIAKYGKIDFVVLWVDDTDEKWQKKRKETAEKNGIKIGDNSTARFRDWGLLKYWFRGVEKYAPWVNNVYFVTEGHLPKWLNINNPRLKIIKHEDFIPKEALPTFNTNAIELCLNNIKGLSEQFVLFNDDLFIINKIKPKDFYKKGTPVNSMSLCPIYPGQNFYKTVYNNIEIINNHFNYSDFRKKNFWKILSLKQGKYLLWSVSGLCHKEFFGFANFHMPNSYKKSTLDEVWEKERERLMATVQTAFRDYGTNISDWVFNYWQFAKGDFIQRYTKFGVNTFIDDESALSIISRQKVKCICLNDSENITDVKITQKKVADSFDKILADKSGFEV